MIIFDANVWIALFNVQDSQHAKAEKLIDASEGESILVHEYIFVEVLNVLTAKAGKEIAEFALNRFLTTSNVEIGFSSKDFLYRTIQTFLGNEHKKLSFVDQSLLYLSQFHKVVTFDKYLARHLVKHL